MGFRYIFIVGCDRTGSTLLTNILNKHSDICISLQTHYMGHLARSGFRQKMKEFGDLSNNDNVYKLVNFMYDKPFVGGYYWRWLKENVEPEILLQKILDTDRSERAIFSVLMQVRAKDETVLGEKTPDHIKYVPTLLEWFPEARIIHTFRDPRAIFISELKMRSRRVKPSTFPYKQLHSIRPLHYLFVLFHMNLEWFLATKQHFKYKDLYSKNYHLLKFEDLISDPEFQIKQLCDFLGVKFQHEMLDQKVVNTGFTSRQGKVGFDKETINRWRDHLNPLAQIWFSLWTKRYLKELGYID